MSMQWQEHGIEKDFSVFVRVLAQSDATIHGSGGVKI
jgi:hypothetical protein